MNDIEAFLTSNGSLYSGLFPTLYADNSLSEDARAFDAGKFDRMEAEKRFKQRRKENKNANPFI